VPLDCVRLVKYDSLHDYIDRSFDGEESQPMYKILGGVRFIYSCDLLLEIKRPDQIFPTYHPGGTVSVTQWRYLIVIMSVSVSVCVTIFVAVVIGGSLLFTFVICRS